MNFYLPEFGDVNIIFGLIQLNFLHLFRHAKKIIPPIDQNKFGNGYETTLHLLTVLGKTQDNGN
jgi:hypothetical protein